MRAREVAVVVVAIAGPVLVGLTRWGQAAAGPVAYTEDFGAFLASANPNLPKPVVAGLVKHHVNTLEEVIDAQQFPDRYRG